MPRTRINITGIFSVFPTPIKVLLNLCLFILNPPLPVNNKHRFHILTRIILIEVGCIVSSVATTALFRV
jgi:hypothetical protein